MIIRTISFLSIYMMGSMSQPAMSSGYHSAQQTIHVGPMLFQCCATVCDAGPNINTTLGQNGIRGILRSLPTLFQTDKQSETQAEHVYFTKLDVWETLTKTKKNRCLEDQSPPTCVQSRPTCYCLQTCTYALCSSKLPFCDNLIST